MICFLLQEIAKKTLNWLVILTFLSKTASWLTGTLEHLLPLMVEYKDVISDG